MCWEPIDGANIPFVEVVYRWRNSKITAAHYFFWSKRFSLDSLVQIHGNSKAANF